jgi:hypothetical protein
VTTQTFRFADGRPLVRRLVWQEMLAVALSVAMIAVLIAPVPAMARFIIALAFTACGPGVSTLAVANSRMFGRYHPGLVVGLGFAIVILSAEVLVWAHVFYPRIGLIVLALLVIAGVAYAGRRDLAGAGAAGMGHAGSGHDGDAAPGVNLLTDETPEEESPPGADGDDQKPEGDRAMVAVRSSRVVPPVAVRDGAEPVAATPSRADAGPPTADAAAVAAGDGVVPEPESEEAQSTSAEDESSASAAAPGNADESSAWPRDAGIPANDRKDAARDAAPPTDGATASVPDDSDGAREY